MFTIQQILFPVDFSERTCGAAPFVAAVARRFGARITLMSVAPPQWYAAMGDAGRTRALERYDEAMVIFRTLDLLGV